MGAFDSDSFLENTLQRILYECIKYITYIDTLCKKHTFSLPHSFLSFFNIKHACITVCTFFMSHFKQAKTGKAE